MYSHKKDFDISQSSRIDSEFYLTNTQKNFRYRVDWKRISDLESLKEKLGKKFPKIGVFIVSYNASDRLPHTIRRIPVPIVNLLEEIYVFDDFSTDDTFQKGLELLDDCKTNGKDKIWQNKLRVYRNPRNYGYGGNQKIGFNYAIQKGFDYVILLHGDGQYAPEYLVDMIWSSLSLGKAVVFGSRMKPRWDAFRGGMPLYKWVGNQILTRYENSVLKMNMTEFHSGFRLYSTEVLKRIPFEMNTNDFHFDTQIIIQCRALGVPIHEISIPTYYGDEICRVNGLKYAANVCLSVIEYRLHQCHLLRKGRYLVDRGMQYQLKQSPYSSHGQFLKIIRNNTHVLDIGCGQGFLAKQLSKKSVKVSGIDVHSRNFVWKGLSSYHKLNLENHQNFRSKRKFDYILLGDVIEHVRNPKDLIQHVGKSLKPRGHIIVSTGNIAIWFYRLSLMLGRFNYGPRGILDNTHVHLYTIRTFKQLIMSAGFHITDISYTNLPFELIFESTGKSFIVRAIDWVYRKFVQIWPAMFAYQTIVEAQLMSLDAARGEGDITPNPEESLAA